MKAIIKLEGAVIRQQKNTILKDVSLEIVEGEFVYLIGRVGSGKTSLMKTMYAELPLDYGEGEVAGYQLGQIKKSEIAYLRRKCGIVFQDFKLLTDRNVYANLEFVLKATGWKDRKAIRERIEEVLGKVELTDKRDKFPHQLSGGEQQRIVLARALLNAPPLILADEPTGNIDPETSYHLIELLKDICDSGKTVIIATHQYDLIEHFPGRVFRCEHGILWEDFSFAEKLATKNKIINNGIESEFIDIPVTEEEVKPMNPISFAEEEKPMEPTSRPKKVEPIVTERLDPVLENELIHPVPDEKSKNKDHDDPDVVGFELI